jgi:hypothetical protein
MGLDARLHTNRGDLKGACAIYEKMKAAYHARRYEDGVAWAAGIIAETCPGSKSASK